MGQNKMEIPSCRQVRARIVIANQAILPKGHFSWFPEGQETIWGQSSTMVLHQLKNGRSMVKLLDVKLKISKLILRNHSPKFATVQHLCLEHLAAKIKSRCLYHSIRNMG